LSAVDSRFCYVDDGEHICRYAAAVTQRYAKVSQRLVITLTALVASATRRHAFVKAPYSCLLRFHMPLFCRQPRAPCLRRYDAVAIFSMLAFATPLMDATMPSYAAAVICSPLYAARRCWRVDDASADDMARRCC